MEKAAKPLKIFISYGHEIDAVDEYGNPYPDPNNESVVRKIKAYLESRGHEIWLDREKIKPGDDWRRSIYEGVEWSDVALICLSRKAMKPNGVCRDEIAIALGVRGGNMFPVKLEALKDSEYPAYLLTRQLFTEFMDWRAHWTEGVVDEAWLDKNLEELAKSLEEKEVGLYGEEMVELKSLLKPWNMNDRLRRLDRGVQTLYNEETHEFENRTVHKFCGRESLFQLFEGRIGQAVRSDSERVLWLKKGPGFGKSRFAAELLYRYYYAISAAYFIEYNQRETLAPHTFVKSVAYQLGQANSAYRKKLLNYIKENQDSINLQTGDPQTLFKTLIVDLMSDEIDGGRATQWILVDALDEATESNRNEIASLISQNLDRLPPWICFFITSRDKDNAVNDNFSQFTPIDFSDEENVSDVRDYIINEFEGMNITVSEDMVNILQEKSEGTFLYPEMVFRDLKKNSFKIDDIRNLPSGVINYIHQQFDRLFGSDIKLYKREIRPMLGFILTSCEPIQRAVLKYSLGIRRDSELDDWLEMLGTFFIQSGSADEDTVVPFHKSVIDYCFDKDISGNYFVYPDEAKEDFANRGLDLYKSGALQWTARTDEEPDVVQRYFLNWLPSYLMNANMKKEAAAILSDFAFLMKRLRFGNVERVVLDYILFRNKLNRISPDSDAYFDVICSNAHFLRRNCDDNPAYKIMLQIVTEVADACPVTQAAERWLNPETGDSPCDWFWLNKVNRPKEYQANPCKLVIENAGNHVLLLSNGDALSWGTNDNNLRIWNLETGVCKAVLEGHTDHIWNAKELPSGAILSWCGGNKYDDKTLRLWAPDGTCKAGLEGQTDGVMDAIELSSGDILSWSGDKTLRLWSPDGECKSVLERHTDKVWDAIELRSGDILSWCGYKRNDHTLCLWSPNGICKSVWSGHTKFVKDAIQLRSGDILSWSWDGTLRLWSPNGTCKAVLTGHADFIINAIELRSGDILSWSDDSTLRIWSPEGVCKAVLEGHTNSVFGAVELRSGDILSWGDDTTLRLWSPDGLCKSVMEGHERNVWGIKELSSGDILSWSWDGTLRLWLPNGTCKAVLEGHANSIKGAIELRSGNILSWSDDTTLRIWSPDGNCKAVLDGHIWEVVGAIELDSGDILSWGDDNIIRIWSSDGTCKTDIEGHTNEVSVIELRSGDILSYSEDIRMWSPDGKCKKVLERHTNYINGIKELRSDDFLSWSWDGTLCLWSLDGTCKAVLEGHTNYIGGATELRSGDILSWSWDETLRLWSPDGTCKAVLEGHTKRVSNAIELRSGDILSWSSDKTLRLWSSDGVCKVVLEGHNDAVNGAIELRSGNILSWCSSHTMDKKDTTLRLWSSDGVCKAVLEGHTDGVNGAIELSSGDILSWSDDTTLRLWSPDGVCKAVLEGPGDIIWRAKEVITGEIISCSQNHIICLWHSDGRFKCNIDSDNPQFDLYRKIFVLEHSNVPVFIKLSKWGIELQHELKTIYQRNLPWNSLSWRFHFVGDGRICVWYGRFVEFLQLNYGNHISVSFEQAHQFLVGEIDESQLDTYVPESKETAIPKSE